ncbi:glycosyltransferase [Sphingomonas immobilis]|uniref:Glycosyltransferase n=1 Tax=Sphingomonas immobilis TaxID=3063997 RepID=A0ABT8ZY11_9SPHN|nr:glycosyltransferase [Sphingomonas sp. CA1-15]MDO7841895.1 glycosyltransferase [Sphingomonas sp. CA1-15]
MIRPIGYFVHHQGRGHAERAAAIVNALPPTRPVTLFCARDNIFPALGRHVRIQRIPSLFETPADAPQALAGARTPATLHCAPLGWSSITQAIATITAWFDSARPALFITDVSAELAQLARIASIPCITVLQHGQRDDLGHMVAYESAIGVLAPYAPALEQPGRPVWMRAKTHYAPGVGILPTHIARGKAREALGLPLDADIVVVIAGGGGTGTPGTPLTLGARAEPDAIWLTIGAVEREWHATSPANLRHLGWVDRPEVYIAAADRIVSSAGNTTVHMIAAAGRPWIVVPEWRYFDEQIWKARMLAHVGAAVMLDHWPAHPAAWAAAWTKAAALDLDAQKALVDPFAAQTSAGWIEAQAEACWANPPVEIMPLALVSEGVRS